MGKLKVKVGGTFVDVVPGTPGATGPTGPTGPTGSTGPTGPTGPSYSRKTYAQLNFR